MTPGSAGAKAKRVQPLEALNPYTSSWTIRVRASAKQGVKCIKTQRGESKVFSVDLTDEQVRAGPRLLGGCPEAAARVVVACETAHRAVAACERAQGDRQPLF